MREIKFRAWDGEMMLPNNSVGMSALVFQHLVENDGEFPEDMKIMQYTGLKDKNGKEIYSDDYLGDWCVFWGSGKYILQNISTGDIIDCNEANTQNKEVTGNRYENPREHAAMASDI